MRGGKGDGWVYEYKAIIMAIEICWPWSGGCILYELVYAFFFISFFPMCISTLTGFVCLSSYIMFSFWMILILWALWLMAAVSCVWVVYLYVR